VRRPSLRSCLRPHPDGGEHSRGVALRLRQQHVAVAERTPRDFPGEGSRAHAAGDPLRWDLAALVGGVVRAAPPSVATSIYFGSLPEFLIRSPDYLKVIQED
ncbi:hypothetical protein AAVH_36301, partial [Aphelenchoides avenae]